MYILGISAYFHNSAAAIILDGKILAQVSEERFTRIKNDGSFPKHSIDYCLQAANIKASDLDEIVYYSDPGLIIRRFWNNIVSIKNNKLDLYSNSIKRLEERFWIQNTFIKYYSTLGKNNRIRVVKHHISHASSAFFPSPFDKAVILTMDGIGELESLTIGRGTGNKIELFESICYPHSLGLFYSALSYFCGFKVNSGEYKFMGLAPYGKPIYKDVILNNLINVKEDGSFRLNLKYYSFYEGHEIINIIEFEKLFGIKKRNVDDIICQRYIDIAASAQAALEEIVLKIVNHIKIVYGEGYDNLVLAGGVALNCVCNGLIARSKIFDNVWVQPISDDAGGALGAALFVYYEFGNARIPKKDSMQSTFLGPCYSNNQIKSELVGILSKMAFYESDDELCNAIAELIVKKNVVGIFRGRLEAGPRALGHRSIIADPRPKEMQSVINLKIKRRESFRPFAPIIMEEFYDEYFETVSNNSFMTYTTFLKEKWRHDFIQCNVENDQSEVDLIGIVNQPKSCFPAITHVNYSARVQTVNSNSNAFSWKILKAFYDKTGCPMLVNTSFNVRGEPIVCSIKDAYNCFLNTEMDALVIGNYLIIKKQLEIK